MNGYSFVNFISSFFGKLIVGLMDRYDLEEEIFYEIQSYITLYVKMGKQEVFGRLGEGKERVKKVFSLYKYS